MAVVVVVCTWRDRAVVCRGVDEIVGRQAGRQVRKLNSVAGGNERESLVSETDAVVSEERENREMSLLREKDATDRQTDRQTADLRRLEGLDGMDCWHSDCDYTRTTTSPLSRRPP